jgi:hypothetical protein
VNSGNQQEIEAPPFSDRRIAQTAEELTRNYVRTMNIHPAILTINFDHIYENYIYPEYGIALEEDCNLGYDEQGNKILGRFDVETNTAYIDTILRPESRDPRRIFTCWHEVGGHGVLQGEWLRRQLARSRRFRYVLTTEDSIDARTQYELDRQANLFAARAAAPTWFLQSVLQETYQAARPIRYVGPRRYCLSVNNATRYRDADDFDHLCRIVAYYVSWRFGGLSLEALGYRIAQVGFITDVRRSGLQLNRVAQPTARFSRAAHVLAAVGCRS